MESVKWGELKIQDVLKWQPQKEIGPLELDILCDANEEEYPFYGQATTNNGIISFNKLTNKVLNNKNAKPTILIHSNNQNVVYLETPFYLKDGHGATSVLQSDNLNRTNQMFIVSAINKVICEKYSYNNKATKIKLKNTTIKLPIKGEIIDFEFMENFISDLEAARISELEAYLLVTGLKEYDLTKAEQNAVDRFNSDRVIWKPYNVEALFGKSTRGKRLKSLDRISGDLPFVTAGETDEGISAWIGNKVHIFSKNTSTIDMFGSAKYRNYEYGADDHVAVVHTENLPMHSAIFITSALNNVSHTGQFDYSRNFYAKDADELNISLPTKHNVPDYEIMETLISAIQKLVIKDVVLYTDRKIEATKIATSK